MWIKQNNKYIFNNNQISYNQFNEQLKTLNKDNNTKIYIPVHNIKDIYEWYRIFNSTYTINDNYDKFGFQIHAYFDKKRGESIKGWFPNLFEVKCATSNEFQYYDDTINYYRKSIDYIEDFTNISNLVIDGEVINQDESILVKNQEIQNLNLIQINNVIANKIYIEIFTDEQTKFNIDDDIIIKTSNEFIRSKIVNVTQQEINSTNFVIVQIKDVINDIQFVGSIDSGDWNINTQSGENGIYMLNGNSLIPIREMYDRFKAYNQIVYAYLGKTNQNKQFYLRRIERTSSPYFSQFPYIGLNEGFHYSEGDAYLIEARLNYDLSIEDNSNIIDPNCCACIINTNDPQIPHPVGPPPYDTESTAFRLLFLDNSKAEKIFSTENGIGPYELDNKIDILNGKNNIDFTINNEIINQLYYNYSLFHGILSNEINFRYVPLLVNQLYTISFDNYSITNNITTINNNDYNDSTTILFTYSGTDKFPNNTFQVQDLVNIDIIKDNESILNHTFKVVSSNQTTNDVELQIYPALNNEIINAIEDCDIIVKSINQFGLFNETDNLLNTENLLNHINSSIIGQIYQFDYELDTDYYLIFNKIRQNTTFKYLYLNLQIECNSILYTIDNPILSDYRQYFYGYNIEDYLNQYLGIGNLELNQLQDVDLVLEDNIFSDSRITITGSNKFNQQGNKIIFGRDYRDEILDQVKKNTFVKLTYDASTMPSPPPTPLPEPLAIYVVGNGSRFDNTGNIADKRLFKLNLDGSIDSSFSNNLGISMYNDSGTGGSSTGIAISNNLMVVTGSFNRFNGQVKNNIIGLNLDGTLNSFSNNINTGFNSSAVYSYIDNNNKILVTGIFTEYNGISANRIIRLNNDGTIDPTFNIGTGFNAPIFQPQTRGLFVYDDDKILIGGNFITYNNQTRRHIIRLNNDGTVDNSFSSGAGFDTPLNQFGNPISLIIENIIVQDDGKILVSGNFTEYNGISANRIIRLNNDGTIDPTFSTGVGFDITTILSRSFVTIALQNDNKIIVGGHFSEYDGNSDACKLIRLNTDGTLDTTFNNGNFGINNITSTSVSNIEVLNNDDIIIVGGFNSYNGTPRTNIALLNSDGTLNTTFDNTLTTNMLRNVYVIYDNNGNGGNDVELEDVYVEDVIWDEEYNFGEITFLNHINRYSDGTNLKISPYRNINEISEKLKKVFDKKTNSLTEPDFNFTLAYRSNTNNYANAMMNYATFNGLKNDELLNNITAIVYNEYNEPRISFLKRDRTFNFPNDPIINVSCATTGNITFTTSTIDGYSLQVDDLVLVKDQNDALQNNIYQWNGSLLQPLSNFSKNTYYLVDNGVSNIGLTFVMYYDGDYDITKPISFVRKGFKNKKDPRLTVEFDKIWKLGVDNKTFKGIPINEKYDLLETEENQITVQPGINSDQEIRFIDGLTEHNIINNINGQGQYAWILNENVITNGAVVGCTQVNGPGTGDLIWYTGTWIQGTWCDGIWIQGTWINGEWLNGTFNAFPIVDNFYVVSYLPTTDISLSSWINGTWYNGTFNGGIINDIHWLNGTFNFGLIKTGLWENGTFNNGTIEHIHWLNGTFTGGDFLTGLWENGTFNQLSFNIPATFGKGATNTNDFNNRAIWRTGTFTSGEFHSGNNTDHTLSVFYNGTFNGAIFYGGTFISGQFNNSIFDNGVFIGGYYLTSIVDVPTTINKLLTIDPTQWDNLIGLDSLNNYQANNAHNLHINQPNFALIATPDVFSSVSELTYINQWYINNTSGYIQKPYVTTTATDTELQLEISNDSINGETYVQPDPVNNILNGNPFICANFSGTFRNGIFMKGYFVSGNFINGVFVDGFVESAVIGI